MSGFLSRLLDRTIEDGPVLRARPQALFERPRGGPTNAPAGPLWPGESHASAQPAARRAPADLAGERSAQRPGTWDASARPGGRDAPRTAPIALPRTPPAPLPASPRETELPRPSAANPAARPDAGADTTPAMRRRRRVEAAHDGRAPAAAPRQPDQAPEPRGPAPPPPSIARSIAPAPPVTAALPPPPRAPAPVAAHRGAGAPPPAAPAPPWAPRGERRQPQRLITQRRAAVARAAAPTRRVRAEPQAPPTVHVTIGRLEVRASSPPAAPRSRAVTPQAPKLGLDEYLRARSGGVR
jgi:hypothetical protein